MTDFGPEYERMEELDPTKFEGEAAKLLHGLGFDKAMMAKGTKDMSGQLSALQGLYVAHICSRRLVSVS